MIDASPVLDFAPADDSFTLAAWLRLAPGKAGTILAHGAANAGRPQPAPAGNRPRQRRPPRPPGDRRRRRQQQRPSGGTAFRRQPAGTTSPWCTTPAATRTASTSTAPRSAAPAASGSARAADSGLLIGARRITADTGARPSPRRRPRRRPHLLPRAGSRPRCCCSSPARRSRPAARQPASSATASSSAPPAPGRSPSSASAAASEPCPDQDRKKGRDDRSDPPDNIPAHAVPVQKCHDGLQQARDGQEEERGLMIASAPRCLSAATRSSISVKRSNSDRTLPTSLERGRDW